MKLSDQEIEAELQTLVSITTESFPTHEVDVFTIDQSNAQVRILGHGYSIGYVHQFGSDPVLTIDKIKNMESVYLGSSPTRKR